MEQQCFCRGTAGGSSSSNRKSNCKDNSTSNGNGNCNNTSNSKVLGRRDAQASEAQCIITGEKQMAKTNGIEQQAADARM